MTKKTRLIPGINIQWPWGELIVSGQKTIETRGYDIPEKYRGIEIAVIQTPGPRGRKEAGILKACIIGTVVFEKTIRYKSETQWKKDFDRHRVPASDPTYKFNPNKEKWGWTVKQVSKLPKSMPPPKKRGIVFATACVITGQD